MPTPYPAVQVAGMKIGGEYIVTGLFIIAVLFLASRNEKQERLYFLMEVFNGKRKYYKGVEIHSS